MLNSLGPLRDTAALSTAEIPHGEWLGQKEWKERNAPILVYGVQECSCMNGVAIWTRSSFRT